ncbi:MAG TPA: tyrosine-type recombinase/integrase [Gemmataceae bacterium]|nr:tyrosine-type recombinase/integrase [Gemmataceae bacterium]
MPHFPKPFFKAHRDTWYVEINRTQHSLGKHPEDVPAPRKKNGTWQAPPEILTAFYKKMAEVQEEQPQPAVREVLGQAAVAVFDDFLEWCQKHKAPLTYVWYHDRIQAFSRTIDKHLLVDELKPIHVERWVDAHPEWSASHQRGCKVAVQRAFSWAEKMGVIDKNPIRHLEKPQAGKREQLVSPDEYEQLLQHYPDEAFRDLLEMAWHTGARPQESTRIEARHVDLENRRVVLPPAEAKGKKRYRIIYLNDEALALVRQRAAERPAGPIFRNTKGQPWTAWAVNNRFCRYQQAMGRSKMETPLEPEAVKALAATLRPVRMVDGKEVAKTEKELLREARKKLTARQAAGLGTKFALYSFRHTFANRLLEGGVDSLTVSTLLGHVDGTMLSRVYAHLQKNADHLLEALNRASKPASV